MKSAMPEWYGHDDDAIKTIVTTGTIALDANVMLDLYRVRPEQRDLILKTLGAVRNRLFVPYQAAYEFQRNRAEVARRIDLAYEKIARNVKVVLDIEDPFRDIHDAKVKKGVLKLLNDAEQDIKNKLKEAYADHAVPLDDVAGDDPIRRALDALIDDDAIGKRPTPGELEALKATAQTRFAGRIPPGYSDADAGKSDPHGDYIIWSELLTHAESVRRPVLFVTGDSKEDWYQPSLRGRAMGPRPELIAEMSDVSGGQPYHQVSLDVFLRLTNRYLQTTVDDETIESVARLSHPDRLGEVMFRRMYPDDLPPSAQVVMRNAIAASIPDIREAIRAEQYGVAASLALSPEFQKTITEIAGDTSQGISRILAELRSYQRPPQLPSAAELYEQARAQLPTAAELYEQARAQSASATELREQGRSLSDGAASGTDPRATPPDAVEDHASPDGGNNR